MFVSIENLVIKAFDIVTQNENAYTKICSNNDKLSLIPPSSMFVFLGNSEFFHDEVSESLFPASIIMQMGEDLPIILVHVLNKLLQVV